MVCEAVTVWVGKVGVLVKWDLKGEKNKSQLIHNTIKHVKDSPVICKMNKPKKNLEI